MKATNKKNSIASRVARLAFAGTLVAASAALSTQTHAASIKATPEPKLVKDINTADSSYPDEITEFKGSVYFQAEDDTNGNELWKTDGTAAGTVMVKDINVGSDDSNPQEFTAMGDWLYFTADDGVIGRELWRTDGTEANTTLVKDINQTLPPTSVHKNTTPNPGSAPSPLPYNFTVIGSTMYFAALEGNTGVELWKSDGTESGTTMVADLCTGSDGSNPSFITALGSSVVFAADGCDGNGIELYKSGGSTVTLVKDISSGSGASAPSDFEVIGTTVYFQATDTTNGTELWKSDGTSAGTQLVMDINPGSGNSNPTSLTVLGGKLYFSATDGTNGIELWQYDPATSTASMLKDINTGGDSNPQELTALGSYIYFSADDGSAGPELWRTDGTNSGTVMVHDINPGSDGSYPEGFATTKNKVFFQADDGTNSAELWETDGTDAGTKMVKDIGVSGDSDPYQLTVANGNLFFGATDDTNGQELWAIIFPSDVTSIPQNSGQKPGTGLVTVDGVTVAVTITKVQNTISMSGPGFSMSLVGLDSNQAEGVLDADGNLILRQGGYVKVTGTGFAPNSTVKIYLFSKPILLGSVLTDGSGAYDATLAVPVDTPAGNHTIQANGFTSDGKVRSLNLGVVVPREFITRTGADTARLWQLALILLVIGGIATAATTRRRHSTESRD